MARYGRPAASWRRRFPDLQLPTVRQISYWSMGGAFGEAHARPGSGRYHDWDDHECAKLSAIAVVAADVYQLLNVGLSISVVQRLWQLLDQSSIATLRVGCVAITASLPETGAKP